MKVVLISGSPRKNQGSEDVAAKASDYFAGRNIETEVVKLSETPISPCIHCNFCASHDHCGQDEVANKLNGVLADADAIITISPVYFGGMTANLKCALDKSLPLRRSGFKLKGKVGAAIALGGSRNGGQELAIQSMHAWMLVHGMVVVGDNNHFGGTIHRTLEDEVGSATMQATFEAVADLLERLG